MRRLGLGVSSVGLVVLSACGSSPAGTHTPPPVQSSAGVTNTSGPVQSPQVGSIDEALAVIQRHVDVPVVLPDGLPDGVTLAPKDPVYGGGGGPLNAGWTLHLVYGTRQHVFIQYGTARFDGCGMDGVRQASVNGMPALLLPPKSPSVAWTEMIWPATMAHHVGRYGLTGSLAPKQMLQMAKTMPDVEARPNATGNC